MLYKSYLLPLCMLAKTGADREMETASAGQEEKDDTSGVKLIDLERERNHFESSFVIVCIPRTP